MLKTKGHGLVVPTLRPSLCDHSPPKIYYHYTSLDKMWKILKSEELWATQAGFSNDKEELLKGIEAIEAIVSSEPWWGDKALTDFVKAITLDALDSYIVCFCDKDDKLSQWRAYCKDGGVSLGFAFDEVSCRYYFSDRESEAYPMKCQLHPVYYYPKSTSSLNNMSLTKKDLEDKLESLFSNMTDLYSQKEALLELIPYIKHIGFEEEEEHRWLIRNKRDPSHSHTEYKLDDIINYTEGDKPCPYVKVKFSNPKYSTSIKILCDNIDDYNRVAANIKEGILKYNNRKGTSLPDSIEYIDSGNSEPQIVVGENESDTQRALFNIIDGLNNKGKLFASKISIWCDGHLPIRSITVAPSVDQQRIIEFLKHQCEHKCFWMRYVVVKGSDIPYRS